jgi:hypothetical protein
MPDLLTLRRLRMRASREGAQPDFPKADSHMSQFDPEETHDLQRHEGQLSAANPPLANWPWISACRPIRPLA